MAVCGSIEFNGRAWGSMGTGSGGSALEYRVWTVRQEVLGWPLSTGMRLGL